MMLVHGVDIVAIGKFSKMIDNSRFLDRCFTKSEQAHCAGSAERFAARFGAKEAVLKSLGIGIADGVDLKNVEIVFDSGGVPGIKLAGSVECAARNLGILGWALSFAHSGDYAIASVIGFRHPSANSPV